MIKITKLAAIPRFMPYLWLFVPYSLWPINVCGLAAFLMDMVSAGRRPTSQMQLLVKMLGDVGSAWRGHGHVLLLCQCLSSASIWLGVTGSATAFA